MTKLITVFGATGVQGGSVVKALLDDKRPGYQPIRIRAITRDPTKPSAQKLQARGVELAQADLGDAASVKRALQGSDVVFAVTNYWEHQSKEREISQGKIIADACRSEGVGHLIWSALPAVTKMTNGALSHVEHFDSKAEVAEYIEATKGDMIATYFMPGFYMQNIKQMIMLSGQGVPTLSMPWVGDKTQVALFDAARDVGTYVAGILSQDPQRVNGMRVQGTSQWLTPDEMVAILSKEIGKPVNFQNVPPDVFKNALPEEVALEMTENMLLVRDYSYFGKEGPQAQKESDELLNGATKSTWREFVRANGPWEWATNAPDLYQNL